MKYTIIALIMGLGILLVPSHRARAANFMQTTTAEVIVHLLDANDQPLFGVTVSLALNRYSDAIEEIQVGSCITDSTGSCSITVSDPPHLRSGRIEGFIDLGENGRQLIGWKGDRFEIILRLYSDGKLATVSAPLDQSYEGQTEQPTDAPRCTSTITPIISITPILTETPFTNTATPVPPTVTVTKMATAKIYSPPIFPAPTISPTPILSSRQPQKSGWVWIGLGLALFAGLGVAFAIIYHRQHKPRQSG